MTQDRRITDKLPGQPLTWDTDKKLIDVALQHLTDERTPASLVSVPDSVPQLYVGVGTKDALRGLLRDETGADTETLAGQEWKAPVTSAAAPAAGQAGLAKLAEALRWALEWIDAVPSGAVLPTMPGFDRDYVNALLDSSTRAAPVAADTEQARKIVVDWPACNPVCDENPEMRNQNCSCDAAKASMCRQTAAPLATPADAGAGLTDADLSDLMTYPSPHGTLVRLADVKCRLAAPIRPASPHNLTDAEIDSITRHFKQSDHYDSIRACVAFAIERLEQRLDHVMRDLNGPTRFGEPVIPAPVTAEPVASIDTPEFREMLGAYVGALEAQDTRRKVEQVRSALVAHINRYIATPAPADRDAIRDQALAEADDAIRSVLWQIENGDGLANEVYGAERCRDAVRALKSMERAADAAETSDAEGGEHE